MTIAERYQKLRESVPDNVKIILAVKKRTAAEVLEAINAGATDLGHNYVQEAEAMIKALGDDAKRAKWHMIGHLQSNKINKALPLFNIYHTIDSVKKAEALSRRTEDRIIDVFIEVDLAAESSKDGFKGNFESLTELVVHISELENLRLRGLMTMGPACDDPEDLRPVFMELRKLKDRINALNLPGVSIDELSMGMSDSYQVAIEEGATMVRIGSAVFGARQ